MKYSRLSGTARVDLVNANEHIVDDNSVADVLYRTFARTGMDDAVSAGERGEIMRTVRRVTQFLMSGESLPSDVGQSFRSYLQTIFGSESGKVESAILGAVHNARNGGNEETLVSGKSSLYDFVDSRMQRHTDGPSQRERAAEVIPTIREIEKAIQSIKAEEAFQPDKLPYEVIKSVIDDVETRRKAGQVPPGDEQAAVINALNAYADRYLRQHSLTSPEQLRATIRDEESKQYGDTQEKIVGKLSLYAAIAGQMKKPRVGNRKGLVTDIIARVRAADEAARTIEQRSKFRMKDLPADLQRDLQDIMDIREEMGQPPLIDLRELAIKQLNYHLDDYLRQHLSGSPEPVKQAIRDMDHTLYGSIRRELGVNGGRAEVAPKLAEDGRDADINDLDSSAYDAELAEVGDREGYDAEGRRVQDTGLTLVPAPSERAVHDDGLPLSGHTTAEHGLHGELGWAKRAQQELSGDHVDIDHVNVLAHVPKMSREFGETDEHVLNKLHAGVADKARQHALDLRDELTSNGVDVDAFLSHLQKEYSRATRQQREAKLSRQPQEFFDAVEALKPYGLDAHQAQQHSDLFWAQVKSEWKGKNGREFFDRFTHSYPTTRNKARSHERLDYYDLSRGVITDAKLGARKDRGTGLEHGVLGASAKDGTPTYLDLQKLIAHSLGKVRSRTETVDEMGHTEQYEPTDGDLRSAYANVVLSLVDSPEFKLSPETARQLLNPPAEMKLTADVAGHGENVVDGKTWGEITKPGKQLSFTRAQRRQLIVSAEGVEPGLKSLSKGVMTGGNKPITAGGEPVAVDVQGAIREAAKQFGIDLNGAPRTTYYALLTEVIRRLRDSGAVDKNSLPMPTNDFGVLNPMYEHLVIGDKGYRNEAGKWVSGTDETRIRLTRARQGAVDQLIKSTRLNLDANRRAIDNIAALESVLRKELEQRAKDNVDPILKVDIQNLTKKRNALADFAAEKRSKGLSDKAETEQLHTLNAEIEWKTLAARKSGIDLASRGPESKGEIARLARDEAKDFELHGSPRAC